MASKQNHSKSEASAALEQSGALAALERENARLRQTIKELKSRLDVWEDEDIVPEKPEVVPPNATGSPVDDFSKAMAANPGSETSMLVWFVQPGRPISLDQELYNAGMSPFEAARDYYFEFWDSMDQENLCNLGDFSILVHDPESQCVFEYEAYIGFGKKPFMQNIPKVVGRHGLCPN